VIRILIVDDHPVFRAGLANLLESEPDFAIVGKAANGPAAVRLWEQEHPDILLLDLSMPGMDGFETLRQIRNVQPDARAIVLTSSESNDDAQRAMQTGARGYLTKHIDQMEIVAAIRDVHRGEVCIQSGFTGGVPAPGQHGPGGLSSREIEVLVFMRKGFSNAEIGRTLGITERTVKAHVTAILKKMHAADRAEAVAKGFDLGILKTMPTRGDDLAS
jgi:DNA-binding NarL/FixJ family response regulator